MLVVAKLVSNCPNCCNYIRQKYSLELNLATASRRGPGSLVCREVKHEFNSNYSIKGALYYVCVKNFSAVALNLENTHSVTEEQNWEK